jgi:hypothetical protein
MMAAHTNDVVNPDGEIRTADWVACARRYLDVWGDPHETDEAWRHSALEAAHNAIGKAIEASR